MNTDNISDLDIIKAWHGKSKHQPCQAIIVIGNQKFTCDNYDRCGGIHQWKGEIDGKEVMIRWK